ncbi:MAG: hypothetical protein QXR58_02370 [Candidatus Micrarchaeaceae archaeon]
MPSTSLEKSAEKYLRKEETAEAATEQGYGIITTTLHSRRPLYYETLYQNPALEALRKVTTPTQKAQVPPLNQDQLLIFRLRPQGWKGARKKDSLLGATLRKYLANATGKLSEMLQP